MNLIRNYKTITTVLMLALYAFIATPVSYWHSHAVKNANPVKEQVSIIKQSHQFDDVSCNLCSHHYSVHAGTEITIVEAALVLHIAGKQLYRAFIRSTTLFSFTGRGPPSIA